MMIEEIEYDLYIQWFLLRECNFSCEYCIVNSNCLKESALRRIDIPRIINKLDQLDKTVLFNFTGGEPFLLPNFTEFMRELTRKHYIRLDTNLSLRNKCEEFMDIVDPKRVYEIVFSTHVLEREKREKDLSGLCELVNRFQKKGFRIIGKYVAFPPLLKRMEKDIDFFKMRGIKVLPSLFVGTYNGRDYPISDNTLTYSEEEAELIKKLNPYAIELTKPLKNQPCNAGHSAFAVNFDSEIFPCAQLDMKLGDFLGRWHVFSKAIKCPLRYCLCPCNKPQAVSLYNNQNVRLTQKTISERGVFSTVESHVLTGYFARRLHSIFKNSFFCFGPKRRAPSRYLPIGDKHG
jgi:MoaA/NifB/PqqE/SkfB family radical SAM enzyme